MKILATAIATVTLILTAGCGGSSDARDESTDPTSWACTYVNSLPNKPDLAKAKKFAKGAKGAKNGVEPGAETLVNIGKTVKEYRGMSADAPFFTKGSMTRKELLDEQRQMWQKKITGLKGKPQCQ